MKTWSEKLITLSKEYLNYTDTRVKSIKGKSGLLTIENNIYTITVSNTDETLTFNSVNEIINSGWVVD
jgi:hypothetical protein